MDPRGEAERWLGIAAKLLTARDFIGSKTFAIRARESDPNNTLPADQILAIVDTVLASEQRRGSQSLPDWYSVLQLPHLVRDPDLVSTHYRRLVFLLSPDRNHLPFADYALGVVMEAWGVLGDPTKKWIFDNELALLLQAQQQQQQAHQPPQPPPAQQQQQQLVDINLSGSNSPAAQMGGGTTYQFFQQPAWQQQQHVQQQVVQQGQGQVVQVQQQQGQGQVPLQWQMRDPTPVKNVGSNGGGGGGSGSGVETGVVRARGGNVVRGGQGLASAIGAGGGGGGGGGVMRVANRNRNVGVSDNVVGVVRNSASNSVVNVNVSASVVVNDVSSGNHVENNHHVGVGVGGEVVNVNENEKEGNEGGEGEKEGEEEKEVESFWTACPYCMYIFEYLKEYQDCTLRCQNCRRGFHGAKIPNPPVDGNWDGKGGKRKGKGKGKGKEKEEGKEESFCCWGSFPLGFSMTAWKKQNSSQFEDQDGASWVPFSPMFSNPAPNGSGNFHWFDAGNGGGNGNVGTRQGQGGGYGSTRRVYIDEDDDEDMESSEADSSDCDWRKTNQKKRALPKGGKGGSLNVRRSKRLQQCLTIGDEITAVDGDHLLDRQQRLVVGLAAAEKPNNVSKNVTASVAMRKQTRRSVKDMGRLDLNVEFNNEGEEHVPAISALNGEVDGIENIAFFEGLDEFLSTLPILNVGSAEKTKAS